MLIVRLIWHIFYAQLSKKYLFTFTPQRYNIFSTYANNCLKKATETPAVRASSILLCDFISLPFHFIHLHLPKGYRKKEVCQRSTVPAISITSPVRGQVYIVCKTAGTLYTTFGDLCGGHKFAFSFGRDVEEICEFLRSLFRVPSVGQRKIKRTAILK